MLISCGGPVNPSSPTFPNINLTQAMTDLLAAWAINQKWLK